MVENQRGIDFRLADDVIEVARAQGVRGGTILNARGIAFSLPVSDVAGLAPAIAEKKNPETESE